jgi:hypothetical protein
MIQGTQLATALHEELADLREQTGSFSQLLLNQLEGHLETLPATTQGPMPVGQRSEATKRRQEQAEKIDMNSVRSTT